MVREVGCCTNNVDDSDKFLVRYDTKGTGTYFVCDTMEEAKQQRAKLKKSGYMSVDIFDVKNGYIYA